MTKKVIIIGAGGHGKVVADIIGLSGDLVAGFLDDKPEAIKNFSFPILGEVNRFKHDNEFYFIVAVGNAEAREKIANKMSGVKWYTAIHSSAAISSNQIGGFNFLGFLAIVRIPPFLHPPTLKF